MMKNTFKRGFTLIELLIVIVVLGILSAVVLVGIDPVDKINAANDSNAQNLISNLANATEAYATNNNGLYPVAANPAALQTALVTSGDLKITLSAPANYTLSGSSAAAGPAQLWITLKSKKYINATTCSGGGCLFWGWCSSSGKAGPVADAATCP
jgi:prepilin-type N-terminal cleavage/methylation domain-containing protein